MVRIIAFNLSIQTAINQETLARWAAQVSREEISYSYGYLEIWYLQHKLCLLLFLVSWDKLRLQILYSLNILES